MIFLQTNLYSWFDSWLSLPVWRHLMNEISGQKYLGLLMVCGQKDRADLSDKKLFKMNDFK